MTRLAWIAVLLGLLLRGLSCAAHELPQGDVLLDVASARSLAAGDGFASGFRRGVISAAAGAPLPPQGHSDQHPPLWPLLGALVSPLAGSPFAALQLLSWCSGALLLLLMMRMGDRLVEDLPAVPDGVGVLAAALVACGFVAVDAAGNGSLYALQALLVLGLVESLCLPRLRPLLSGALLGLSLLLNHQALVLLPLPLALLLLSAPAGARGPALRAGLSITAVALACQLPWWLRNAVVFDSPFHSVNGLYLRYWAGGALSTGLEQGQPVQRVGPVPLLGLARAMAGFARMNALYLLLAGLLAAPCLAAIAAASAPALLLSRVGRADRRKLGLALAAAALLSVALLWPASKLRYLVALVPLATLLGLSALVRARTALERGLGWAVLLLWVGALVFTLDDISGAAAHARPLRFAVLAAGGALVWALPLWCWRRGPSSAARLMLLSGLPVVAALALAVALGPVSGLGTGTAYHGTWFLPDAFGQDKEALDELRAARLGAARDAALDAGLSTLAGPIELLAWPQPALLQLPGLEGEWLLQTLSALAAAGRMDGVVLEGRDGPPPGLSALDELLEPLAVFAGDGRAAQRAGPWVGLFRVRSP
ncbi:MAG: hypothetical protein DRQ55_16380 [Planctomycetota bacterium]|nr:MAG: hypothetical protein DRQ55_16380 [Planctomycetota bacterium]